MAAPKLSSTRWAKIRSAYEGENPNVSALAERYGLSRSLLQKRAAAQGWVKGPEVVALPEVAVPDRAIVSAADEDVGDQESGLDEGVRIRVLHRQQLEWAPHRRLICVAARVLFDPAWRPDLAAKDSAGNPLPVTWRVRLKHATETLEAAKLLGAALTQRQRGEREAFMILGTSVPSRSDTGKDGSISPAEALRAVLLDIDASKVGVEIESTAVEVR